MFSSRHKTVRHIAGAVLLVTLAGLAAPAAVLAGSAKHAPLGYQLLCLKIPAECQGGGKAQVLGTPDLMAKLKRVNSHVNRSISPRADRGADVWSVSTRAGDCEDYVLAKRRALISSGVPAASLRVAYVKTKRGEGHAVLVVRTKGKDLVLDNLTQAIRPLSQTGYRIVSMQGADPSSWS